MKIAILGYGVEGESVYKYYRAKYPDAVIVAYDNNGEPKNPLPPDVEFVGGVDDFIGIEADIAIKTPAIQPWKVSISGELTTSTREFLRECPAPVIGVTGSKGKGTTASLIASILSAAGKKAWLVGNIGVGALDVLDKVQPDDVVVYELSSFQLWDLDISPRTAVILGIEPEHLNVHKDMDDYVGAKANITVHQNQDDTLVYKVDNAFVETITGRSVATKIPYQDNQYAHVADGFFWYGEQKVCSVGMLKIPGIHNQDNACAAIDAVWDFVSDGSVIGRGLADFQGLDHRLKFVRNVGGVEYYDDSIATTISSVEAAINAFESSKILILGGSSKGTDFKPLSEFIARRDDIKRIILIGLEASSIEQSLQSAGFYNYDNLGMDTTMSEVVQLAASIADAGDRVVLSPACASFDMFDSYQDRGNQFIQAVENL